MSRSDCLFLRGSYFLYFKQFGYSTIVETGYVRRNCVSLNLTVMEDSPICAIFFRSFRWITICAAMLVGLSCSFHRFLQVSLN